MVEGYPHDLQGEKVRSQFLYSATRSLFEQVGFSYERPKGKKNCVMRMTVPGELSPAELLVGRTEHLVDEQPDERDYEHADHPRCLGRPVRSGRRKTSITARTHMTRNRTTMAMMRRRMIN